MSTQTLPNGPSHLSVLSVLPQISGEKLPILPKKLLKEDVQDSVSIKPSSSTSWIVETENSKVSDGFLEKIQEGWTSLPELIRNALVRTGWKVKVGRFLTEIDSSLKGVQPRGGDVGTRADNRGGVCIAPSILLAEYQWLARPHGTSKFSKSKSFPSVKVVQPPVESPQGILACSCATERVMRHEAGHALDHYLRKPSTSKEFALAYDKDFDAMDAERKEELYYYIQPDQQGQPTLAGKSEAFAEAVATLHGGGCNQTVHFLDNFPNLIKFTNSEIQALLQRKGIPPSAWSKGPPAITGLKQDRVSSDL